MERSSEAAAAPPSNSSTSSSEDHALGCLSFAGEGGAAGGPPRVVAGGLSLVRPVPGAAKARPLVRRRDRCFAEPGLRLHGAAPGPRPPSARLLHLRQF